MKSRLCSQAGQGLRGGNAPAAGSAASRQEMAAVMYRSLRYIEEAIELAEKCTHAHQIGWYRARSWGEGEGRDYDGAVYEAPNVSTNHTYAPGERVWVTGQRIGTMSQYLPIIDPLTGTDEFVKAEWYRPVRRCVYTSKRTITGPVIFADYFDGVPAR